MEANGGIEGAAPGAESSADDRIARDIAAIKQRAADTRAAIHGRQQHLAIVEVGQLTVGQLGLRAVFADDQARLWADIGGGRVQLVVGGMSAVSDDEAKGRVQQVPQFLSPRSGPPTARAPQPRIKPKIREPMSLESARDLFNGIAQQHAKFVDMLEAPIVDGGPDHLQIRYKPAASTVVQTGSFLIGSEDLTGTEIVTKLAQAAHKAWFRQPT